MATNEFVFGLILVIGIFAIAGYFLWQQFRVLRQINATSMSTTEEKYYRARTLRRMIGCFLLIAVGCMLVGSYFLEPEYQRLAHQVDNQENPQLVPVMESQDKAFFRRFTIYWIVALLFLFGVTIVAALDVWATLRFGFDQHRKLRQTHQAELEEQLRKYRQDRQDRNGYH